MESPYSFVSIRPIWNLPRGPSLQAIRQSPAASMDVYRPVFEDGSVPALARLGIS